MDTSTVSLIPEIARLAAARLRVPAAQREDLRQEAALAAIEALPRFDSNKGELRGFLYTVALNRLRNLLASENVTDSHLGCAEAEAEALEVADFAYEPLTYMITLDEARRRTQELANLRRALGDIPPSDLALLRKIYVDGARHHELAKEVSCSRQAITKRHHNALTRLQERYRQPALLVSAGSTS